MDLVLVDGPNLFGSVGRHLEKSLPQTAHTRIGEYLSGWFDIDRLVRQTLLRANPNEPESTLGTVIVHSNRQLGKDTFKLEAGAAVSAFWGRQAALPNTSSLVVDVPGDQQEQYPFKCDGCGTENRAKSSGEKGVDSTMIVYMFETSHQWQSVCLFSRDADFVPAVWALRRRGKRVLVAAEPQDSMTGLGRASQSFLTLALDYVLEDFGSFELLRKDGILDQWFAEVEFSGHPAGVILSGYDHFVVSSKSWVSFGRVTQLRDRAAAMPNRGYLSNFQVTKTGRQDQSAIASFRFHSTVPMHRIWADPAWLSRLVSDPAEIPEP